MLAVRKVFNWSREGRRCVAGVGKVGDLHSVLFRGGISTIWYVSSLADGMGQDEEDDIMGRGGEA